jgi:hypothetical protein
VDRSVEDVAEAEHPAETLVRVAEREEAALTAVGSRGLGRAQRFSLLRANACFARGRDAGAGRPGELEGLMTKLRFSFTFRGTARNACHHPNTHRVRRVGRRVRSPLQRYLPRGDSSRSHERRTEIPLASASNSKSSASGSLIHLVSSRQKRYRHRRSRGTVTSTRKVPCPSDGTSTGVQAVESPATVTRLAAASRICPRAASGCPSAAIGGDDHHGRDE